MQAAMNTSNRRNRPTINGVPMSGLSQSLDQAAYIDITKETPLSRKGDHQQTIVPPSLENDANSYYPTGISNRSYPPQPQAQIQDPNSYNRQYPPQQYPMHPQQQYSLPQQGYPNNRPYENNQFGYSQPDFSKRPPQSASNSRRGSMVSNSSVSFNKFLKRNMKKYGGGGGGAGDEDDFDDGGNVEVDPTNANVSFDELAHIRDRGRYGQGAHNSSLDTTPYIPTLSSKPKGPNGQLTNTQYRRQVTHQKKLMASYAAGALDLTNSPRTMSLQSGPMSMGSNGGYMQYPPPQDPRSMSLVGGNYYNNRPPMGFNSPAPQLGNGQRYMGGPGGPNGPPRAMSLTTGPYGPQPPRAMSLTTGMRHGGPQRPMNLNNNPSYGAPVDNNAYSGSPQPGRPQGNFNPRSNSLVQNPNMNSNMNPNVNPQYPPTSQVPMIPSQYQQKQKKPVQDRDQRQITNNIPERITRDDDGVKTPEANNLFQPISSPNPKATRKLNKYDFTISDEDEENSSPEPISPDVEVPAKSSPLKEVYSAAETTIINRPIDTPLVDSNDTNQDEVVDLTNSTPKKSPTDLKSSNEGSPVALLKSQNNHQRLASRESNTRTVTSMYSVTSSTNEEQNNIRKQNRKQGSQIYQLSNSTANTVSTNPEAYTTALELPSPADETFHDAQTSNFNDQIEELNNVDRKNVMNQDILPQDNSTQEFVEQYEHNYEREEEKAEEDTEIDEQHFIDPDATPVISSNADVASSTGKFVENEYNNDNESDIVAPHRAFAANDNDDSFSTDDDSIQKSFDASKTDLINKGSDRVHANGEVNDNHNQREVSQSQTVYSNPMTGDFSDDNITVPTGLQQPKHSEFNGQSPKIIVPSGSSYRSLLLPEDKKIENPVAEPSNNSNKSLPPIVDDSSFAYPTPSVLSQETNSYQRLSRKPPPETIPDVRRGSEASVSTPESINNDQYESDNHSKGQKKFSAGFHNLTSGVINSFNTPAKINSPRFSSSPKMNSSKKFLKKLSFRPSKKDANETFDTSSSTNDESFNDRLTNSNTYVLPQVPTPQSAASSPTFNVISASSKSGGNSGGYSHEFQAFNRSPQLNKTNENLSYEDLGSDPVDQELNVKGVRNPQGLQIHAPTQDDYREKIKAQTVKKELPPLPPITPNTPSNETLLNYRLTLNFPRDESDSKLSQFDFDEDFEGIGGSDGNIDMDADVKPVNKNVEQSRLVRSPARSPLNAQFGLSDILNSSYESPTREVDNLVETVPSSAENDEFDFTDAKSFSTINHRQGHAKANSISSEMNKMSPIVDSNTPQFGNVRQPSVKRSIEEIKPVAEYAPVENSSVAQPAIVEQKAFSHPSAPVEPISTVFSDAEQKIVSASNQKYDSLLSPIEKSSESKKDIKPHTPDLTSGRPYDENVNFTPEQLGIISANTELLNELQLVSNELAESISREFKLEAKLKSRSSSSSLKSNAASSVNFGHIENDLRLKGQQISELSKQLTEERRKRYAAEDLLIKLQNNANSLSLSADGSKDINNPRTPNSSNGDNSKLLELNYKNSELSTSLMEKTDYISLTESKIEMLEQDKVELTKKLTDLQKDNKQLSLEEIPKLKNQIQLLENTLDKESLTKENESLRFENQKLKSQLSSSSDELLKSIEEQRDNLREVLKSQKTKSEMEVRMLSDKIKALELRVAKLSSINTDLSQRLTNSDRSSSRQSSNSISTDSPNLRVHTSFNNFTPSS